MSFIVRCYSRVQQNDAAGLCNLEHFLENNPMSLANTPQLSS